MHSVFHKLFVRNAITLGSSSTMPLLVVPNVRVCSTETNLKPMIEKLLPNDFNFIEIKKYWKTLKDHKKLNNNYYLMTCFPRFKTQGSVAFIDCMLDKQ